jgi:hypothetical protein
MSLDRLSVGRLQENPTTSLLSWCLGAVSMSLFLSRIFNHHVSIEYFRFLNHEECVFLRQCFTGIYTLDSNEEGDSNAAMVRKAPSRYVMKPQREGGGYNIYGTDIPHALDQLTREERSAYILMDKIVSPAHKNTILLRDEQLLQGDIVSELGIFGVYIATGTDEILNESAG